MCFYYNIPVGTESGNASRSLTNRFNGPGMEKLQETSSGLAGVMARNKQVSDLRTKAVSWNCMKETVGGMVA